MTNPMVTEVNRLLANLLARGERVALPGIGSLIPVTRSAQRVSRKKVLPPVHEIDFSSEVSGTTLAEQMAAAADCDLERAEDIYDRWLAYTWVDGVLTIEGVGVLKMKHFTPEAAFESRLNPEGRRPMTVRRRTDWMIWVGVVAVLVALGMAYYGYTEIYLKGSAAPLEQRAEAVPEIPMKRPTADTVATAEALSKVASDLVKETEATFAKQDAATQSQIASRPAAPATREAADRGVMTMTSGHHYVVLGVFSTPENAERAATRVSEQDETMRCGVYRFGAKWMVSPFESEDREACELFRRAHTATHPDMWIHKAR